MKEWWNQLSLRDKRLASVGVCIVVATLLYILLWLPLANKNTLLRTQVQHNQQLVVWMKAAEQELQTLKKGAHPRLTPSSGASLLSTLQISIKRSPLKDKFTQLKQSENDTVQINFQSVNFDELMAWLIQLWQEQGIVVSQLSVTAINTVGNVSATVALKKVV